MIDGYALFDDIDTAYKKGWDCYNNNGYYSDNPYSAMLSVAQYEAWNDGFSCALDEHLSKTPFEEKSDYDSLDKAYDFIFFTLIAFVVSIVAEKANVIFNIRSGKYGN